MQDYKVLLIFYGWLATHQDAIIIIFAKRLNRRYIMNDAIIISDIHLGTDVCQSKILSDFLDDIDKKCQRLILNGDVFDSMDFRRLKKNHWKILSHIRKLSDKMEIIWIAGNHDGPAEIISHLLGIEVLQEYILCSGDKKILIIHGDKFDDFLDAHPVLTAIGDWLYYFIQKIDKSHNFARFAKHNTKEFMRCAEKVENLSREYAFYQCADIVCTGHTHLAVEKDGYYNSGCWTEYPCTYLAVKNGEIKLKTVD